MDDLFLNVLNGNINNHNVINEKNNIIEDGYDLFTEAVYPDAIPYLKTLNRILTLPKGEPSGRGNICFLFTPSIQSSIDIINSQKNFKGMKLYYYYFYNMVYRGTIFNRKFHIKEYDKRKDYYNKIKMKTKVNPYLKMKISQTENRNMYFDMNGYFNIFNFFCKKLSPKKKIYEYWQLIKSVILSNAFQNYSKKFILINATQWKFGNKFIENLNNPIYLLYYTLYKYFDLIKDLDIDIYIYTDNRSLKINPSKCDRKTYVKLKVEISKIYNSVKNINNILDEKNIEKTENEENIVSEVLDSVVHDKEYFTGQNNGTDENIDTKIRNTVKQASKEVSKVNDETIENKNLAKKVIKIKTEEAINDDKKLIEDIYKNNQSKKIKSTPSSTARDKMLKEEQYKLKVGNMTISDLKKKTVSDIKIPTRDVVDLKTTNENIKHIRFNNFEKTYNKEVMQKDIINAILSLNNKSIPMYVRNIDVKDTSDELNYKDTYTIYLEDSNRQRHTIKVDIPKFIEDKFLYIGGNKKIIKKQNFLLPVIKSDSNTVQITTNYNKIFISRVDNKSLGSIEKLKKMIKLYPEITKYFISGNTIKENIDFITTLEYDELSKLFSEFKNNKCHVFFSQTDAQEYMKKNNIKNIDDSLFVGVDKNSKPIFIDNNTQTDEDGNSIIDILIESLPENMKLEYHKISQPKRLIYAKGTIMAQEIPMMALICFWEGFTTVLNKMNLKYELVNSKPKTLPKGSNYIQFSDCYMIYPETVQNALLMNGLRLIETSNYSINNMNEKDPYIDYFTKVYGKASISNALMNFYDFFIDNITEEVLEDINLPTDTVELIIYAVSLLADSQYTLDIDQSLSRIRSNEIIPAILYEALAKNYVNYRNYNGKKKFSIPQDIVIKNILAVKTVEDYSTLNPALELDSTFAVSSKGFRGVNLDEAYTVPKRSYDPSMIGIISPSTAPDANVGVGKTLTLEPSITSVRGYTNIQKDNLDNLKDANLFSPAELLIPLGATRDDPTRLGHAMKQSRHVIPVKHSSPVLISNGMEETCRFLLSSDFVVNADEDGEVVERDEESKILIIKYKSGKCRAVNLGGTIVKNAGGGFFLSNVLVSDLKVGDKVKKDSVIAYHKDFFKNSKFNNCRMNMGTLSKVAIMSTYNTYEDATVITHKLSEEAATEMCFIRQVVIGKNSNVTYMIKKGEEIKVGEPLVQFDTSYDDNELNVLLANLGDGDKDKFLENSKNNIKSKYSGVITDIKMYSSVPLDELSPSLKKIFSNYYKKIKKKNQLLEKYDPESINTIVKCGLLCNEPTKEVEPNKFGVIKGQKAEDAVVIEFFVQHEEPLEVGSKLANFTALKNTVGEIIPEGYEPYSEFRPEEEVSSMIASNSILKRMTPSIILTALGNKCIIELKRKLKDIYES